MANPGLDPSLQSLWRLGPSQKEGFQNSHLFPTLPASGQVHLHRLGFLRAEKTGLPLRENIQDGFAWQSVHPNISLRRRIPW